jgi:predicted DNA-binding transcriptional regulator AlpA
MVITVPWAEIQRTSGIDLLPRPQPRFNASGAWNRLAGNWSLSRIGKESGVGRSTIYRWLADGQLPDPPKVCGIIAIAPKGVQFWLNSCRFLAGRNASTCHLTSGDRMIAS